ncbi:E3 ubiquitin/ISG15 ligase TRIM25-like [Pseudophryne corroboree]|uniref:E3 ubiquitin/ISG15 ligase TRIM25-like n=1 Tax=Pseudophryne corroboree TaxID=495146 RepID=UPI0030817C98
MASATVQEEQSCLICENSCISVTLSCGHTFCQDCIDHALNEDESGDYICPECRDFPEIPSLSKNTTLCKTADRVLHTQLVQEESLTFCTNCIHSLVPAVKTCLLCEAYLCSDHLTVHSKSADHVLSVPTSLLDNIKCSVHNKVLEYYCYEDAVCICVYCAAEEHRSHHLEPMHEASKKRMEKLRNVLNKLTVERGRNENRIQSLLEEKKKIPSNIANLTEKANAMFRDIWKQLEDLEKRVHIEISRHKEQVSLSMSEQVQQLEIKNDELSRKMCHIEELCDVTDPLMVLQGSAADLHDAEEGDNDNKEEVDKKDSNAWVVEEFIIARTVYDGLKNLVTKMSKNFCVPEPSDLLLDLNTAANNVAISSDLKSATWSVISQRRKETPERFRQYQVLSIKRFLSGQHYWEVETSESEYWMVGMAYSSTKTKGDQSWIGNNKTSWCFCRWFNEYSVRHDCKDIQILSEITCNRYGIHLDYEAGQLSFYELCNPVRHLHTFITTFTKPLHAAFWVTDNGWIKIRSSE